MPETEFEAKLPSLMLEEDAGAPRRNSPSSGVSAWWIAAIAAGLAMAAAFYWWQKQTAPSPAVPPPPIAETPAIPKAAEPAIRHPIEEARAVAPSEDRKPLPALGESDAAVRAALATLSGASAFERLFFPETIVRRFVATIDNLPRRSVAPQVMIAKPVPGVFLASTNEGTRLVNGDNGARYAPYVRLADTMDTKAAVALYVRFYPWFQQAYQDLGYPSGYFNDRLIDVIDHLLATPDVSAPIALEQPHVLYAFADPNLESLSAGQKIMLRMGTGNAAHVKAKLREVRGLLTGVKPELHGSPPG